MSSTSAGVSCTSHSTPIASTAAASGTSARAKSSRSSARWTSEPRTLGSSPPATGVRRVRARRRRDGPKPEQALEVEPVAAAGIGAERAVGQPLRSRPRAGGRRGQDRRRVRERGGRGAGTRAPGGGEGGAREYGVERRGRVQPTAQPCRAAVPGALDERLRPGHRGGWVTDQCAGDPVDRRPAGPRVGQALAVDAAREDQPLARPRHRDVEQPPLLLGVGRLLGVGEALPVERGTGSPPPIGASFSPTLPSGPSSSRSRPPPAARPRSATHTTGNSSPLARWIVISRTASSPSDSSAASPSRASTTSCVCANVTKPRRSGPSARS